MNPLATDIGLNNGILINSSKNIRNSTANGSLDNAFSISVPRSFNTLTTNQIRQPIASVSSAYGV